MRFLCVVLSCGELMCGTPPAVGCAGLLWLAGCCTSPYFRACTSSQAVRVLALTLKSARACCVFSRAESEVPSFLSLFPWKTSVSWLLPSTHRGRRNFLALVGISLHNSGYCFVVDAGSAGMSVRCSLLTGKHFLQWEERGKSSRFKLALTETIKEWS